MTGEVDVDAYFRRIGYQGGREPTLDTLRALHARHPEAIPFENLNPLLKRPVPIDTPSLERKLVREGRGGYCYEHNLLFLAVLKALGFAASGLAARVVWNAPGGVPTGRTHVVLRVELDGVTHVADVGFGGQTLTGPLRLETDVEQTTPHEPFRLVRAGAEFRLESKIRGEWKPLYLFDLQEQFMRDYEVGNWYVSTYPGTIFVNGLFAARTVPGRRYALLNNEMAVHNLNAGTERHVFTDASELRDALTETFHITLPDDPNLDTVLTRLTAQRE